MHHFYSMAHNFYVAWDHSKSEMLVCFSHLPTGFDMFGTRSVGTISIIEDGKKISAFSCCPKVKADVCFGCCHVVFLKPEIIRVIRLYLEYESPTCSPSLSYCQSLCNMTFFKTSNNSAKLNVWKKCIFEHTAAR